MCESDYQLLSQKHVLELKLNSCFEQAERKREERPEHLNFFSGDGGRTKVAISI